MSAAQINVSGGGVSPTDQSPQSAADGIVSPTTHPDCQAAESGICAEPRSVEAETGNAAEVNTVLAADEMCLLEKENPDW